MAMEVQYQPSSAAPSWTSHRKVSLKKPEPIDTKGLRRTRSRSPGPLGSPRPEVGVSTPISSPSPSPGVTSGATSAPPGTSTRRRRLASLSPARANSMSPRTMSPRRQLPSTPNLHRKLFVVGSRLVANY